ncbi:hypothetical protein K7H22_06800 [Seohaeicola saemankumensis]|uniref:hypothetical protein n=1 Tax=Seohaeicola saemankumensis TaxID=481181 RepID=UPI001E61DB65|nr:hypothetical protein [Seohaeicola saemankumensis]MCD1625703.1 hypothetical protein [Seohaeicola saemankumensis]
MFPDSMNRRLMLTSLLALVLARPLFAQHSDEGETTHESGQGRRGGGQGGRPDDAHSGEDDHGDDHAGDDGEENEDDHGEDHASGGRGKGPRYRGGRETASVGVSQSSSLEDRVLKSPSF